MFAGPIRSLRSPREPAGSATAWRSAILKVPVTSAEVHALGLVGDAQKETTHHGGPVKAVLVYAAAHYPTLWDGLLRPHAVSHAAALRAMAAEVDASTYTFGAFGENLTVDGLVEETVCLGDVWRIGSCELQITEPRGPCATLARRWLRPALRFEVHQSAAAGWYNAVRRSGTITVGDDAVLLSRVTDEWTMARVYRLENERVVSRSDVMALRDAPFAGDGLRRSMERRLSAAARLRD